MGLSMESHFLVPKGDGVQFIVWFSPKRFRKLFRNAPVSAAFPAIQPHPLRHTGCRTGIKTVSEYPA
jgi:hypothetical protein